jgi:hypothetical protein
MHVLSGIRTNDPSVRASEDRSCLSMVSNVETLYRMIPLRRIIKFNSSSIKTKLARHVHPVAYTEFRSKKR